MKKPILLFLLLNLIVSFYHVYSQDVIVKKNGEEVKGKVLLVGKKSIQYKNFEDPEFPNQSIDIEKVKKIRYEDGTEKVFDHFLRHYIGVSVGVTDGMGDFRSDDPKNSEAGYASSGTQIFSEGGLYLFKNFGIAMAGGYFGNRMEYERLGEAYKNNNNPQPITSNQDESNKYKSGYFMVGPLYSLKIGKLLAIDAKILTGILTLQKPHYVLTYTDNGGMRYSFDQGKGKGTSIGVMGGLAVRFHITRYLGLRLATDFVKASPKIKNTVIQTLPGSPDPIVTEEKNVTYQKLQVMKMSVGLVFLIKRK